MSNSYLEKLKDPRWQQKRLKIFERDNWECDECGKKTEELHIHHKRYPKTGNPWDAEDDDLKSLCKSCHEKYTKRKKKYKTAKWLIEEFNTDEIDSFGSLIIEILDARKSRDMPLACILDEISNILSNEPVFVFANQIGKMYKRIRKLEESKINEYLSRQKGSEKDV